MNTLCNLIKLQEYVYLQNTNQSILKKTLFFLNVIMCIFCTEHEGEMLKESQLNQEYLKAELEEAKNSLRKTEVQLVCNYAITNLSIPQKQLLILQTQNNCSWLLHYMFVNNQIVLQATQESLETELQSTVKALIQVTQEKETQMEECKEAKALHASMIEEFKTSTYNLKSLLQEEQNR